MAGSSEDSIIHAVGVLPGAGSRHYSATSHGRLNSFRKNLNQDPTMPFTLPLT
jgi:hypothetical protein